MQIVRGAEDARRLYARAGIEVVPLSPALGAEIRGVDLRQALAPATWTAIHPA